jgi:hypothetical protein
LQHKFIPDEFVFVRAKKVTQKTRPGRSCYAYPQPSSLPMASQDGPLAKVNGEGTRRANWFGRRSLGYFSFAVERKVTRNQGEIKSL